MSKITLAGKEYDWSFKFKAQRKFEELTKLNSIQILEILQDVEKKGLPFEFVLKMAFCGLYAQDSKLTIEKVEDILDSGSGKDLSEIIMRYNSDMGQYLSIKTDPNELSQTA